MKSIRIVILFVLTISFISLGQSLKLEMKDIDYSRLPRISFSLCVTDNNTPVQNLDVQNFTFKQNGIDLPLVLSCPDLNLINSVMLVLDNSGSMSGSLPALNNAAGTLVDSLRTNDEAALVTFGPVTLVQDFTSDKMVLHNALNAMTPAGNTPLWDAMLSGVLRIASRPGKHVCIILTDGDDNASSVSLDSVITAAQNNNVILFTIGFGPSQLSEQNLRRAAFETGGNYYRVFGAGLLTEIFNLIRQKILSTCCSGWYDASPCTDSIRSLHVEVHDATRSASFDTTIITPSRPDTLIIQVVAPDEVAPAGNAIVYFKLDPRIAQNINSAFTVRIRYNSDLLTINPLLPITIGTLCEGQTLSLTQSKNTVLVRGDNLMFAYPSGNLFGIRFKGVAADSSRLVPITIDSISFANGCPAVVKVIPDTIAVCQCKQDILVDIDSSKFVAQGKTISLPVRIIKGMESLQPLIFTAMVSYDPKYLTPVNVESSSSILTNPKIIWHIIQSGIIQIDMMLSAIPSDSTGILFSITFKSEYTKEPIAVRWSAVNVKLYQRCCPLPMNEEAGAVLVDGACDKIAQRKGSIIAFLYNNPNPVNDNSSTEIRYGLTNDAFIRLEIFDLLGRSLAVLKDSYEIKGEYVIPFSVQDNAKGIYYYRLTANQESVTKRIVLIK